MTAYLLVTGSVTNPEKIAEYAAAAGPVVAAHGGALVASGKGRVLTDGNAAIDRALIISFPDRAAMDAWYNSPEYQAIIPLRDAGADLAFVAIDP